MRILAIDPGTLCGWALSSDGQRTSGVWDLTPQREESPGFRYLRLERFLRILSQDSLPTIVVYELVERHAGTSAAHVYGAIVGIIQKYCAENKIPYKAIPNKTWKKIIVGNGNAKKEQILEYAKKRWPEITFQDQADAVCILQYALENVV